MRIDGSDVSVDWEQARLNGGNYCFQLESDGRLCGRADRWIGHHEPMSPVYHPFVKIGTVFADLEAARWARDRIAKYAIRLEQRIAELEKNRERLDWLLVNEIRLVWSASDRKYYTVKEDGSVIGPGASWKKAAIDAAMAAERED